MQTAAVQMELAALRTTQQAARVPGAEAPEGGSVAGAVSSPDSDGAVLTAAAQRIASRADGLAAVFQVLNVAGAVYVVLASAVAGFLTLQGGTPQTAYAAAVLSFSVTVVKTLAALFSLEKRGAILKDVAYQARAVGREARPLFSSGDDAKSDALYAKLEELELKLFSNDLSASAAPTFSLPASAQAANSQPAPQATSAPVGLQAASAPPSAPVGLQAASAPPSAPVGLQAASAPSSAPSSAPPSPQARGNEVSLPPPGGPRRGAPAAAEIPPGVGGPEAARV